MVMIPPLPPEPEPDPSPQPPLASMLPVVIEVPLERDGGAVAARTREP
jgi:hypothetical protein